MLTYREERQDHPPAQVQIQEDTARPQEEKDPDPGHILRLQGVQEEADAYVEGSESAIWSHAALSEPSQTCPR